MFKVEQILKYKGRGKNKQALVKWKGWPKKFNSWMPTSNLVSYKAKQMFYIFLLLEILLWN